MIQKCIHSAAKSLILREFRNVVQTVAHFIGDPFYNQLQAMRIERDGEIEVPFNQWRDYSLCDTLLQMVYACIANMHVYDVLHYLKEQGPFIARFITGYKYAASLWEISVTYDGIDFILNVSTDIPDDTYRLVEIPYEDCSLELFETEGGISVLDHLRHIKHSIFMEVLQLQVPLSIVEYPITECRVPVVTQYLGNQNPYTKEYSLPQVSLPDIICSEEDFTESIRYYLSWHCIKVVIFYQTIEGEHHEEVVCNTGNIVSQDTRHCLYLYAKDVLRYMRKYEQCTLRIYIGTVDNMDNVIAVDFSTQRDEDGEYEYEVTYLTSPKLSAMTKKEIEQYFKAYTEQYLHKECDMRDRMIVSMREIIEKIPPITGADSSAPVTETDSA